MQHLGKRMARGAAWMVAFKLSERALGLLSTIVLARVLIPEDFGLVAMATAVLGIVELVQALGFDITLISTQDARREHYDTAWTLNLLLAALCALLLLAGAHYAAGFYRDPRVEPVIWALAAGVLVNGLENIGIVALRKELEFQREFWFRLTKKAITTLITLSCAFALRSYWALVIGMVCSRMCGVGLSYLFHPYRPRWSLVHARAFIGFSKWLLFGNLLVVLRTRGAHLLVGRLAGAEALGLYTISFEVSNLPTTELSAPINRAVFPGYSKLASDRNALRSNFLKVFSTVAVITMPAAVGISLLAEMLVLALLGPNWAGAIPLVRILALFGLVTSAMTNLFYVFIVCGMPSYNTGRNAVVLALQLPLVAFGCVEFGLQGAAAGALIGASVPLPFVLHRASQLLGIDARAWLNALWRPTLATLAMALAVLAVSSLAARPIPLLMLPVCIGTGVVVYTAALLGLWKVSGRPEGAESFLVSVCRPGGFGARAAS